MEVKDKRRYTRNPIKIEARYQDSNRKVLKGTVTNIGINGLYIETPHVLESGEIIRMTLDLIDEGRVIYVEGKVVHCAPRKGMGIESMDQDNREIKKLMSTMSKLKRHR